MLLKQTKIVAIVNVYNNMYINDEFKLSGVPIKSPSNIYPI